METLLLTMLILYAVTSVLWLIVKVAQIAVRTSLDALERKTYDD
jgi:uncharacterized membrane protein